MKNFLITKKMHKFILFLFFVFLIIILPNITNGTSIRTTWKEYYYDMFYCSISKLTNGSCSCISWIYSDWSACSDTWIQIRTVFGYPSGCTGTPSEPLTKSCAPICISWDYSAWTPESCPQNEQQTRTASNPQPSNCTGGSPVISRLCIYIPPVTPPCTSWTYSSWTPEPCPQNGQQERTIISSLPSNCVGGNPDILSRLCTYNPITVSISANPMSVPLNGTSTISWSSTGADSCTITEKIGTYATTTLSLTATSSPGIFSSPLTTTTTFIAECKNLTSSATTSVIINTSSIIIDLKTASSSIPQGASTTISWNITNANSCDIIKWEGTASSTFLSVRQKSLVAWKAKPVWNIPSIGIWASPAFADLDNDGDYDLLIGEWYGTNYNYENIGSSTNSIWKAKPIWNVPKFGLIPNISSPAFADLDNDGDYDLLIGAYGSISYALENIGSFNNPIWKTKPEWNSPPTVLPNGSPTFPAFADLDNDSDYDLLIGGTWGTSTAFKNIGLITNPVWTKKSEWNAPNVGKYNSPAFADLDNDSDYDLLIGEDGGVSYAFENIGSSINPVWTKKPEWNAPDIGRRSFPAFADLDNDGDYDLLIGDKYGASYAYENIGSKLSVFSGSKNSGDLSTTTTFVAECKNLTSSATVSIIVNTK